MADLGSCPAGKRGGTASPTNVPDMCADARVGPQDGIPEIIAGSRALRVGTCAAGQTTCPELGRTGNVNDPAIGRAYVFDGRTRAVLKRIDMPLDHRQTQVIRGAGGQPSDACDVPRWACPVRGHPGEGNAAGVGPCDVRPDRQARDRIGDADGIANDADPVDRGEGRADLFISTRGYRVTSARTAEHGGSGVAVRQLCRAAAGQLGQLLER